MKEQTFDVATPDGAMKTFLSMPDGPGPFSPVILFMDIWGMRKQLHDIARVVANEGYACAAPSLYYRAGDTAFERRNDDGRTKSISALSPEDRDDILAYRAHLSDDMVVSDAVALVTHMRGIDGVSPGYAGSFGYCMGGRHAIKVAAALPETFRATACLHGTDLATREADSPHLGAPNIRGEVYFGYGELDPFTQSDTIDAVRNAFSTSPAAVQASVHTGAHHGYAIPDRDVYDDYAAASDWQAIFAMFRRVL